jgi:uncharacterized surface protein with fasciclin (FAS1) repeats
MKHITIVATLAITLGVGAAVATASPATTAAPTMGEKNLVQTAIAAGQFKTLASLLTKAGLADTLEGKGPFTGFAPTDSAFAKAPQATLAALAKNEAKLRGAAHHVIKGKVTAAQAMTLHSANTSRASRSRSASAAAK